MVAVATKKAQNPVRFFKSSIGGIEVCALMLGSGSGTQTQPARGC